MQASTTRVETFSDGVMAIMITIMVLEFKLPDFNGEKSSAEVQGHLVELVPSFIAYLFSFSMIGILWTSHHHLFHLLKKTDNHLLKQNLLFLFWISLIPVVTGIMGSSPFLPISTALYGLVMLCTMLSLSYMRAYTIKRNLIHTDQQYDLNRKIKRVSILGKNHSYLSSAAYLISIPLAFVSVYLSYLCFMIPLILFLLPVGTDEEKLEDAMMDKNS
jgi:uncharacterized membrane protein